MKHAGIDLIKVFIANCDSKRTTESGTALNNSQFLAASGFHGEYIIVKSICRENPAGKPGTFHGSCLREPFFL